jgi:predicted metallo-beta-lactamase superfamily hydrolase
MIMMGGPPVYLAGFKVDETQLQKGLKNLTQITKSVPLTVVDHHALRDETWRQKMNEAYDKADEIGHQIRTAAEFAGYENNFLESRRRSLFIENPPSKEFEKWMREGLSSKSHTKPPI